MIASLSPEYVVVIIKHVEDDFCYMGFTKYDVDERAIKDYKILIRYQYIDF